MDLSEIRAGASSRHPWEIARARAILRVLAKHRSSFGSILDYGCGDAFTGQEVQRAFGASELAGIDIHLPAEACGRTSVGPGTVELSNDEAPLGNRKFELLLLCDVIEHVEDDRALVGGLVQRRMTDRGLAFVTVPAFQGLFSNHDRALRHFRRYTLGSLRSALGDSGLEFVDGGYLFASLIAPRLASKLGELLRGSGENGEHGIGAWRGGPRLTRWLVRSLVLDNTLLLGAHELGLTLPGLSAWALCKKP